MSELNVNKNVRTQILPWWCYTRSAFRQSGHWPLLTQHIRRGRAEGPYGGAVASNSTAVVVVVLTLTRIIKSVATGQAPVTLELRNTPGKTHTTQGGTRIYHS